MSAPASSWLERLETAMMAATLAATADLGADEKQRLLKVWLHGTFNAAAAGLDLRTGCGAGLLEWRDADEERLDLIYRAVTGFSCSLGRVYRQPNGSWASLVIAGVRDTPEEAQAAAEWAVSLLTAG